MNDFTTGQLASRARVNVETIRYYERNGLVEEPPRSASGYRKYPADSVERLRFIKRAQSLGFSLQEIKELLELRMRPDVGCADIRRRAQAKLEDVDRRLRELRALRASLVQLTRDCAGSGPVSNCSILQSLGEEERT